MRVCSLLAIAWALALAACQSGSPAAGPGEGVEQAAANGAGGEDGEAGAGQAGESLDADARAWLALARGRDYAGVLLVQRGAEVLVRAGLGEADRDSAVRNHPSLSYRIGSLSKAFTATLLAIQVRDGLIGGVDDPVSRYLPDYPNGDRISLRQLADHRSGIPNLTDDFPAYFFYKCRAHTPAQAVERFADRALSFEPGTQFAYSNSNYLLLGHLLEVVTGESYQSLLRGQIAMPLGLVRTRVGDTVIAGASYARGYTAAGRPAGCVDMSLPLGAGGLTSTVDDLALWGASFWQRRLLDQALQDDVLPGDGNHFGWQQRTVAGVAVWDHPGTIEGFAARITLVPAQRGVIVTLSNREGSEALNRELAADALRRWFR